MRNLLEFLINKPIKNLENEGIDPSFIKNYIPAKVKATGDTVWKWYNKYGSQYYKKLPITEKEFIEKFSKIWCPGEGETMGIRYLAHYLYMIYNVHLIVAGNYGNQSNRHFAFFYTTEDEPRKVLRSKICKENTAFCTNGGFHGSESDINWFNKNIKNRQDFAEEILKIVKETFKK